ncbi:hypothetical protein OEZ86_001987 [Tetradesmus obliquus]|uniref:Uncharacterized protein n=1 Tax=Tetradesmus obliquus TaxID=3088 RepID=A0A383VQL0_TETOB|nr:hypothetical protein OEZ86_001987 [Tetradesmus obliquus]|eukprot:jgi/Sobl393_1/18270/SZX77867.1
MPSCPRVLKALEDCQRKAKNDADWICAGLTAAAGWCIFASLCPAEVRAIEDCIGIGASYGKAPVIPQRCQDRAALLEACLESHQDIAKEKTGRCKGAQPIPKPQPAAVPAAAAAAQDS